MNDNQVIVSTVSAVQQRATEVRETLSKISVQFEDGYLDMCDLLREAQEGDYHHHWGFERFSDWLEQASGLDMSARQGYYLVNISKYASILGLTRQQLKAVKVSKLKEIFSLDIKQFEAQIRELIEEAPALSLEEVKSRVRALKGQGDVFYVTLKLDKEVKPVLDQAMELARRNYGSVVDEGTGEIKEISDSKAIELIMVSFCQDINNTMGEDAAEEELPIEDVTP